MALTILTHPIPLHPNSSWAGTRDLDTVTGQICKGLCAVPPRGGEHWQLAQWREVPHSFHQGLCRIHHATASGPANVIALFLLRSVLSSLHGYMSTPTYDSLKDWLCEASSAMNILLWLHHHPAAAGHQGAPRCTCGMASSYMTGAVAGALIPPWLICVTYILWPPPCSSV